MLKRSTLPCLLGGLLAIGGCSASLGIGDDGKSPPAGSVASYNGPSSSTPPAPTVDPIAAGLVPQGSTVLASGNAEYSAFAPADGTIYLYDVSTNRVALTEGVKSGNKIVITPSSGGVDYSVTRSDGNETGTRSMPAGEHRLYFKSTDAAAPTTPSQAPKSNSNYY